MNPRYYLEDFPRMMIDKAPFAPAGNTSVDEEDPVTADIESLRRELLEFQVTVAHRSSDAAPTAGHLAAILAGVRGLAGLMGSSDGFIARLQGVEFRIVQTRHGGFGRAHGVSLNRNGFEVWTVVHELGHAWDGVNGWKLSERMRNRVGAGRHKRWYGLPHLFWPADKRYWYYPGNNPPPCGIDANFNAKEDFAEAVTASVFPEEAARRADARGWPYADPARGYAYASYSETPRAGFILELLS
jgi:hypothetical protein